MKNQTARILLAFSFSLVAFSAFAEEPDRCEAIIESEEAEIISQLANTEVYVNRRLERARDLFKLIADDFKDPGSVSGSEYPRKVKNFCEALAKIKPVTLKNNMRSGMKSGKSKVWSLEVSIMWNPKSGSG